MQNPFDLQRHWYTLDDEGRPVRAANMEAWAKWQSLHPDQRILQRDELPGGIGVSTVFLGMDHNFGDGSPLLWETMIFGGPHDEYQERYATKADALAGHAAALKLAQAKSRR